MGLGRRLPARAQVVPESKLFKRKRFYALDCNPKFKLCGCGGTCPGDVCDGWLPCCGVGPQTCGSCMCGCEGSPALPRARGRAHGAHGEVCGGSALVVMCHITTNLSGGATGTVVVETRPFPSLLESVWACGTRAACTILLHAHVAHSNSNACHTSHAVGYLPWTLAAVIVAAPITLACWSSLAV